MNLSSYTSLHKHKVSVCEHPVSSFIIYFLHYNLHYNFTNLLTFVYKKINVCSTFFFQRSEPLYSACELRLNSVHCVLYVLFYKFPSRFLSLVQA